MLTVAEYNMTILYGISLTSGQGLEKTQTDAG